MVAVVAALALAAGCGEGSAPPPRPHVAPLVSETVGRGAQAAMILRVGGRPGPRPVVLFLHGWGATRPRFYAPWLEHLAREGNVVIYPHYQESVVEPPPQVLGNVLAGVRAALERVDAVPGDLVVVGHSAGGALAADYAAIAHAARLPEPRAVLSVYPGRRFQGIPFALPTIDPARIPAATRLLVLAGTRDTVVGSATARSIVRGARHVPGARRTLRLVTDPDVADHLGPQRSDAASRATFWRALDELIGR